MAALPSQTREDIEKSYGEKTAAFYDEMMEGEMAKETTLAPLRRLADQIRDVPGALLDVSCGGGHMLRWWADTVKKSATSDAERDRALVGRDIAPQMLDCARKRLSADATLSTGSMTELAGIADASCAGMVNCFAIHHVNEKMVRDTIAEARRVLVADGGCFLLEWWEGEGEIPDHGDGFSGFRNLYPKDLILAIAAECGLEVAHLEVLEEPDFKMMMGFAHFVVKKVSAAPVEAS